MPQEMNINLKPCPFCGVKPTIRWEAWKEISPDSGCYVLDANHTNDCFIMHMNGTNTTGRISSFNAECIVDLWNRRASDEELGRSSQYYHDGWIPCDERMPLLDEYGYSEKVLVCFSNYSGCDICEYRKDEEQNGWYVGDSDDNPEDIGIHVVAWRPLPEPYKEVEQNE